MSKGNNDWDIYIGNIPHSLTKDHIAGLFKKYNIAETDEIHSNGTKTFCFMKFRGEDNITNAVTEMNSHNVNGRKLIVRRFENKRQNGNARQECNGDTKFNSSSSTFEDIPPLLETQFRSENNSDSNSYIESRAHYSSDEQASGYRQQNSSKSPLISCASPQPSGYNHHNATHNNFHMSPRAKNSSFSNNHNQLNETLDFSSPIKRSTPQSPSQHSQLSPQGKNTQLRTTGRRKQPPSHNKSTSQKSDRSLQYSADHDQSSHEKHHYVHCTRNVISYNPRDLGNSKMKFNSTEHSLSEAVKVWVANFPFGTTKVQMSKLFEDFSPLKVYINNNAPGQDLSGKKMPDEDGVQRKA